MIGTGTRKALSAAVGCLLLAGCGAAKPSTPATGANPPVTSAATSPPATTAAPVAGSGNGLTACGLITEQDASNAIGSAAGPGTAGGTAVLSECIYGDGALIVSMKTDGKAFYDREHADARAKGATDVPGVGDSAFEGGTDQNSTLAFLKGTTLVSIIFNGTGAQETAVAVAKVAASKL